MIFAIACFFILAFLILRTGLLSIDGLSPWWVLGLLGIKLVVAIFLSYLYTDVYELPREKADIFKYYDDGLVLSEAADEDLGLFISLFRGRSTEDSKIYEDRMKFWADGAEAILMNDNRAMIRFHAFLSALGLKDYPVHVLLSCFISLLGAVLLFRGLSGFHSIAPALFIILCVIPPSVLIWTSGPLKEALLFLPLALILIGLNKVEGHQLRGILIMLLGIGGLFLIRPYVFIAVLPALFFYLVSQNKRLVYWKFLIAHATVLLLVLLFDTILAFGLVDLMAEKRSQFIGLAEESSAGSLIETPSYQDFQSFLCAWPSAIWRTYFRPGVWEIRSLLDGVVAIENLIYLLLALLMMAFRKKFVDKRPILFVLSFIICSGVVIGTSVPVLGASVRYRVAGIPFFLFMAYLVIDWSYLGRILLKKEKR